MALVHQIIDFVDDINHGILKEAGVSAPGHIKKAEILTHEDRERLDPADFALVMRTKEAQDLRKFPITDQANTWLSCRYFEKTAEQLPFVAQKIAATQLKRACAIHDVKSSEFIDKLASPEVAGNFYDESRHTKEDAAHRDSVKVANVERTSSKFFYALGEKYPMPDQGFVKKACAYFAEHQAEFSDPEDRFTFASNVIERAKELDVKMDKRAEESLSTFAGVEYGDTLDKQIRLREELFIGKPDMAQAIKKLATHKPTTEPTTFAKVLYQLDKRAGVTKYYGGFLDDAFKATFAKTAKASFGYKWEDAASGVAINENEIEKTATNKYDKIKSYFGQSVADELKKHAVAIFDSLPVDAKITIAKIATGAL